MDGLNGVCDSIDTGIYNDPLGTDMLCRNLTCSSTELCSHHQNGGSQFSFSKLHKPHIFHPDFTAVGERSHVKAGPLWILSHAMFVCSPPYRWNNDRQSHWHLFSIYRYPTNSFSTVLKSQVLLRVWYREHVPFLGDFCSAWGLMALLLVSFSGLILLGP